jgi:hypothetical protein
MQATNVSWARDGVRPIRPNAKLDTVTEQKHESEENDWENEGGSAQQPREKTDREEFFSNQEQVSRPDHHANGEKATKHAGSNPDPSI